MNRATRMSPLTVLLVLLAGIVQAAEAPYPTRTVRMVVGFPPGGALDVVARIISSKLAEAMGQNWVVDNRSGASGNLGTEIVARAKPDGHTVLMALSTQLTVNPNLYKLAFEVERDLQPVTMINFAEHLLIVHPSVPVKTFKDFLALAKHKPGALNYASAGVGSSLHMAAELLMKRAGIQMTHVPYKGAGPAVVALLAGESQVLTGTTSSTIQFITGGRLRALATMGAKRSKVVPDVPTVAESGFPGFEADAWYALLVPAGTPRSIVERIRTEALKALQQPDVQTTMARQALDPESSTPAELGARIKRETAVWAEVIRDAGVKPE